MENKEQKEKKNDEKESLRYSLACVEHRRKLIMPELDEYLRKVPCISGRSCYVEGCPIYKAEPKTEKTKKEPTFLNTPRDGGQKIDVDFSEKPKKKEKKISRETEEFLYLQSRVIGKLSWNPQIWQALDNLSVQEILDRLLGKTGLEGVATHVGGDMQLKASPKTKKLFETLEKQYAEEDEAKGKSPLPNYEDDFTWIEEEPTGFFDKGVFVDPKKKEAKKDDKKPKTVKK